MADKEKKSDRVLLPISPSEVKAIDDWRRTLEDLPSRAEAIRRLIAYALERKGKRR